MTTPARIIPSYPHSAGCTKLAYSQDGRFLITAGADQLIRKFTINEESKEPETFEQHTEPVTSVAASRTAFASASEDCTINLFNLAKSDQNVKLLTRCTLPVREVAFSPDGEWLGVASEETNAKLVNTLDMHRVVILRGHSKSVKHITFHPNGNLVTTSSSDGSIYVFSITSEDASLLKKLEGIIPALDVDSDTCAKVVWHPDGTCFAAPTPVKDIQLVAMDGWEKQVVFKNGHTGDITDLAWSPNGAYLASSGSDGKVHIWQAKDQTIITTYNAFNVIALAWQPFSNTLSFTTSSGQLYRWKDCLPTSYSASYGAVKRAPTLNGNINTNSTDTSISRSPSILSRPDVDPFGDDEDDDFIIDDDGAGYVPFQNRKRGGEWDDAPYSKRGRGDMGPTFRVKSHEPFQSGSTPWRGNRRYLTCNMIGHVWTVDQDTHNTVTCEFYDREAHHQFFFTDPYLYDKACLNDYATLFASPSNAKNGSMLFYRPHEIEGPTRQDWRVEMPTGENITSIALSRSHVVACTSKGYVRVYTTQGTPVRLYRQKHMPVVTCASWKNYIMVVGNGGALPDGTTELTYSIEDVLNDEMIQSGDTIALPPGGHLKSVFFSEEGDPAIFDSEGVLLVLMHWRKPGQAKWVPLLDTSTIKETQQTYWPISISEDKFHCIILKGEEKDPYFPRPLFSELDFTIPCHPKQVTTTDSTSPTALEERHLRLSILHSLLEDSVSARTSIEGRSELSRKETEIDRTLLPLIQLACKEERTSKVLELVKLLRKRASLEFAGQIAVKYGLKNVADRIGEIMMDED